MKVLKIIIFFCASFCTSAIYAQQNRVFNNDSIFWVNGEWSTKYNSNSYLAFDSTEFIIRFNPDLEKNSIINYLINKQILLLDSIDDFKLCKINNGLTFARNTDTLSSSYFLETVELNIPGTTNTDPNDPYYDDQIHLSAYTCSECHLGVEEAWNITTGDSNIVVAVIDAYPDWSHADIGKSGSSIHENIRKNPREDIWTDPFDPESGDGIDNDGNGLIDDWKGWDFYNNTNDTRPITGYDVHGTHVMGIIAAKTNNNLGVAGIAGGDYTQNNSVEGGAQVIPINICNSISMGELTTFTTWRLGKAIRYAYESNANIISFSLSYRSPLYGTTESGFKPSLIEYLFKIAVKQYNCIIFSSSGNATGSGGKNPNHVVEYPASSQYVYAIGGLNNAENDNPQNNGDYSANNKLDFVAYSDGTATTTVNDDYIMNFDQTSSASPQASGVAALLLSYYNCATNDLIYNTMKLTAFQIGTSHFNYNLENYTHCNEFGYGLIRADDALALLISYEIANHNITSNTTWTTPKIARQDIEVESGVTLTLSSELYMSSGSKIIVNAGGNLVVDGGKITSGCGWEGIVVNGIANTTQNASTFAEVEITNDAIIENASTAIKSLNGGIVITENDAVFRNNYQSIVFEKYTDDHIYSSISDTKFIVDAPPIKFLRNYSSLPLTKEFIRINGSSNITISSCEFEVEINSKNIYDKGIGINMYNAGNITINDNCQFKKLYKGINFVSNNGILNDVNISSNDFVYVIEPIRVFNSNACIGNNTILLPNNADVIPNNYIGGVGIYTHGSAVKIFGNEISSDIQTNGYGVDIRNSKLKVGSIVENNTFENLKYGTQTEGYNKSLKISCNSYTDINDYAWSINPFYMGENTLPMQGEDIDPRNSNTKRAGNLFYDREISGKPYNHIRSSVEFVYNAADNPDEAVPEYYSSVVEVEEFAESNNLTCVNMLSACESGFTIPQLHELLNNTNDKDSITLYTQYLIEAYAQSEDPRAILEHLVAWSDTAEYLELLIGSLMNFNEFEDADDYISFFQVNNDRDQDYYDFYSNLIARGLNGIADDSITSTELIMYMDIISRNNDISDLVMAYLNFHHDSTYLMLPEQWEEEESRPMINPNSNLSPKVVTNEKQNSLELKLYPNPANNELVLYFHSEEYKTLGVQIFNAIGEKILEKSYINNNQENKLNTTFLKPGVYQLKLVNNQSTVKSTRFVIMR